MSFQLQAHRFYPPLHLANARRSTPNEELTNQPSWGLLSRWLGLARLGLEVASNNRENSLLDTREVALQTTPDCLILCVRDDRIAHFNSGSAPGLSSIRVAGRSLTHPFDVSGQGISISHGDVCGLRFQSANEGEETAGSAATGIIATTGFKARRGSQSVGFRHDMDWQDPTGNTLLQVALVVRVVPAPSMGAAIDLSIWMSAGEQEEVLLGETDDSLLHLHLAPNMLPDGGGHIRNGLGDYDEIGIDHRRAPWFSCVGVIDGETVGISAIDHPDNPTYPATWRVRPGRQDIAVGL